ncbi:MAG: type II secretion system F family protein [Butyrivibrio sp.]|uniref:type II secretion system F family protein n=1 Tax=Butyrivibrio sp. TaxID=28121 RepID=UPI0025E11C6A|nr:type II secretion system F family protein [Butyrivibrio sp.]MCR5771778.1 type II secretion system F family protein [Butyrivibrio sp.]
MELYIKAGIYALVLLAIVVLCILAREEELPDGIDDTGISGAVYRAAGFIYTRFIRRKRTLEVSRIKNDLSTLTPTNKGEEQAAEYYIKKIGLSIIVIAAGCIMAIFIALSSNKEQILDSSTGLSRSDYGGATTSQSLVAVDDQGQEIGTYNITVDARKYTDEELTSLQAELASKMEKIILSNNKSLDEVHSDLNLVSSVEGYPFKIQWTTDQYKVLGFTGKVKNEEVPDAGITVNLKAKYTAQDLTFEQKFSVCVYPKILTDKQARDAYMNELIEGENKSSETSTYQTLPDSFDDQNITWKKEIQDSSSLLMIMVLIIGVLLYYIKDEQLKTSIKDREEEMIRDYSQIISKLVLYLGAGMTLRSIFEKLCVDYEQNLKAGMPKRYAYEEIRVMVNELRAGESEARAYEMFGLRCRSQPYTRLVNLLTQNLRKGNSSLLMLLKQEAAKASEERLNIARKAGEKVTTKLLAPMMMMLGIVMIIIMYPAFTSF